MSEFFRRRRSRRVRIGDVAIGGGEPIAVQSMAKVATTDVAAVLRQCEAVARAGGDLFRVAVPDEASAKALREIVKRAPLPIIADIHFDYRLALAAIEAGAHKLRINPGNIGSADRVRQIAAAAAQRGIPIRVGVNAGSLPKDILLRHGGPTPQALVEAAERQCRILEETGFSDIVVSLKSSSPRDTLEANSIFAERFDYPLHVGVTEAGFGLQGVVASACGLSILLAAGLGDTVRVSLTEPPEQEVRVAREVLRSLGLRRYGIRLLSCPTCARCEVDVQRVAREVWERIKDVDADVTVAVMGCVVNGPGEASHADVGVACGRGQALIFRKGKAIRKVPKSEIVDALVEELNALLDEEKGA